MNTARKISYLAHFLASTPSSVVVVFKFLLKIPLFIGRYCLKTNKRLISVPTFAIMKSY